MKKIWILLLSGAFFLLFAGLVTVLQRDPNLATAMVAFGTLVLALVTALSIINTNEQEKQRREEKRRYEIRDWARLAIRLLSKPDQPGLSPSERMAYIKDNLHFIKADMLNALANAESIGGELEKKTVIAGNLFIELDDAVRDLNRSVLTTEFMSKLLSGFNEVIRSSNK